MHIRKFKRQLLREAFYMDVPDVGETVFIWRPYHQHYYEAKILERAGENGHFQKVRCRHNGMVLHVDLSVSQWRYREEGYDTTDNPYFYVGKPIEIKIGFRWYRAKTCGYDDHLKKYEVFFEGSGDFQWVDLRKEHWREMAVDLMTCPKPSVEATKKPVASSSYLISSSSSSSSD